jgi:hypothetical protein
MQLDLDAAFASEAKVDSNPVRVFFLFLCVVCSKVEKVCVVCSKLKIVVVAFLCVGCRVK